MPLHATAAPPAPVRAILVLEDGTLFEGETYGADGRDLRRSRLLDRDDRLPGDAHRPVLPPPGGRDDRPAHRQHGHERRGPGVLADLGGGLRRPRPGPAGVQLALAALARRRAARPGRRRHLRHRHPRPDPPAARARRDAGRDLLDRGRPGGAAGPGARVRPDGRRQPVGGGVHLRGLRRARGRGAALHGRGGRPRPQGQHPADDGRARDREPRAARRRRPSTTCWPSSPTGCSSPTDPATRPPPPRRSRCCRVRWSGGCPTSASASATSSSAARWASAPTSSPTATAGSTSRSWTAPPARSRSPPTTTASPSSGRPESRWTSRWPRPTAWPRSPTSASTTTWSRVSSCARTRVH